MGKRVRELQPVRRRRRRRAGKLWRKQLRRVLWRGGHDGRVKQRKLERVEQLQQRRTLQQLERVEQLGRLEQLRRIEQLRRVDHRTHGLALHERQQDLCVERHAEHGLDGPRRQPR